MPSRTYNRAIKNEGLIDESIKQHYLHLKLVLDLIRQHVSQILGDHFARESFLHFTHCAMIHMLALSQ
jgi:hypothetical protein